MSSKRGRKRNDNLPPNRARDVQRAFRARRAAHLQALEQRVSELEEENDCLRQALNLPAANRPPLGKGPTGKDRPKLYNGSLPQSFGFHSSRESSSAESPVSRTRSLSPSAATISLSSRPMQVIHPHSWDNAIVMTEDPSEMSAPSTSYEIPPMSTPIPLRPPPYQPTFSSSSGPSSSRTREMYMNSPENYSQSSERSPATGNSYDGHSFGAHGEIRDRETRHHYSYSSSPFHDPNMHSSTPPLDSPSHPSHPQSQRNSTHNIHHNPHHESPAPYQKRYLSTESGYSTGQGFPHLPTPIQISQPPEFHRQNSDSHLPPSSRTSYGPDGRLNPII